MPSAALSRAVALIVLGLATTTRVASAQDTPSLDTETPSNRAAPTVPSPVSHGPGPAQRPRAGMARVTIDGEARFVTYLVAAGGFQPLCAGQCEVELPVGPQRFAVGEPDGMIDTRLTMVRPLVDVRDGARIRVYRENGRGVRVGGIVLIVAGLVAGVAIIASAFGHEQGPCPFAISEPPATCSNLTIDGGRLAAGVLVVPLTATPGALMIAFPPRGVRVELEPRTAAASWPRAIESAPGAATERRPWAPGVTATIRF